MKEKQNNFHGSDLEKIALFYGVSISSLTGFASNVNPLGISPLLKKAIIDNPDAIISYPDRDYLALREAIEEYANVSKDNILIGNGATELISLLINNISPKNALLIGPSYSEYERAVNKTGGKLTTFLLKEEDLFKLDTDKLLKELLGKDLLIICNPNNPTGTLIETPDLEKIFSAAKKDGIFVMIDETYAEFSRKNISSIPLTKKYDNIFVLRGVSKFFASPGLRLGYGVTSNKNLLGNLLKEKDPWSVHSIAAKCGPYMFKDSKYIEETLNFHEKEMDRVLGELSKIESLKTYPVGANFINSKII